MKAIIDPALKKIPPPAQILDETIATLPQNKLAPNYVKSHFSESLSFVAVSTYAKFQVYQKNAAGLVADSFITKYREQLQGATTQSILQTFMPLAVNFELRTSQMRRSRAGSTFEYIVLRMLQRIDIKSERTARRKLFIQPS